MDNSRILQRNGRLTGIPACGSIPRYNCRREACAAERSFGYAAKPDCGCNTKPDCGCARERDRVCDVKHECGCARERAGEHECGCHERCTYLAISSVKMQKWCDIYEAEKGYCKGTIFSQLDLPFCGMRGGRL